MTNGELAGIRAAVAASTHRVSIVDAGTGHVVVKAQRPARSAWRARALNAIARGLGITLLRAVPAHGGVRGQEIEVERLRALRAAGLHVPEVLHVEPGFMVLEMFSGVNLVSLVEQGGRAGFEAWRRGLAAIVEVHAHGAVLSHAFARNFIATASGLGMIDFEDDPLEAMLLEAAQARDWLAYLHSTLWLLDRPLPEIQAVLAVRLADESPSVRALVEGAGRRLSPLRHLPNSRRVCGREALGARALGSAFPLPAIAFNTIDGIL